VRGLDIDFGKHVAPLETVGCGVVATQRDPQEIGELLLITTVRDAMRLVKLGELRRTGDSNGFTSNRHQP